MHKAFTALSFVLCSNENQNDDINISLKPANRCCSIMNHLFSTNAAFLKYDSVVTKGVRVTGLQVLFNLPFPHRESSRS